MGLNNKKITPITQEILWVLETFYQEPGTRSKIFLILTHHRPHCRAWHIVGLLNEGRTVPCQLTMKQGCHLSGPESTQR